MKARLAVTPNRILAMVISAQSTNVDLFGLFRSASLQLWTAFSVRMWILEMSEMLCCFPVLRGVDMALCLFRLFLESVLSKTA